MTDTPHATPAEIKQAVDALSRGFEEFKAANDAALRERDRRGAADIVSREKVERLNAELSKMQRSIDRLFMAAHRPGLDGASLASPAAAEHKAAFFNNFIRKGVDDGLQTLESKALSIGTDAEGGFAVPREIDQTIERLLTNISPIRRISNVVQIGSANYRKLVNLTGATSGWVGETGARAETGTPTFAEIIPPLGEIYANPAATQTMLDDGFFNVEDWLAQELASEFEAQEGAAFVNGDGVNKPQGFLQYTTAATGDDVRAFGTLQHVATGVDGGWPASNPTDALIDLVYALAPSYRQEASFVMNTNLASEIRKFKDANGDYLWRPGLDAKQPATLLGYPVVEAADMPDRGSASLSVAFGNFRRGYIITERFGTRVLRDPFTNKPYVHFYATKRTGGGVVNSQALKILKFSIA